MPNKRNIWLDLLKLALCYMIICIHYIGEGHRLEPLWRVAVPLYFAISGYFNYVVQPSQRLAGAKRFVSRSAGYLLLGFGFYILFDFVMCYVDGKGVGYYFTTLFYENPLFDFFFLNRPITYSGAQLWFLIALFVVSLVHFGLIKLQKERYYLYIVPVTMTIQLFFGGYMRLFQYTDMPIRYTRNAWFCGLPFFGLGYLLAQLSLHKKWWLKWLYLVLGLAFFQLQIPESRLIEAEVYASTVPACAFLLLFFLGLKSPKADFYYQWFGKNMPFYVYILHMAVGIIVGRVWFFSEPLVKCLVIWLISLVLYEIGYLCVKLLRSIRQRTTEKI